MNTENIPTPPKQLPEHLLIAEKFAVDIMYKYSNNEIDEILEHIKHLVSNRKDAEIISMKIEIEDMQEKISELKKSLEYMEKTLESI